MTIQTSRMELFFRKLITAKIRCLFSQKVHPRSLTGSYMGQDIQERAM